MKYIVRAFIVWLLAVITIAANSQGAVQTFKSIAVDSNAQMPRFSSLPSYGRPGALVYVTGGADSGLWVKRIGAGWMKSSGGGGSSLVAGGSTGDIQVNAGGTLSGLGGVELNVLRRRAGAWVAEPDSVFTNGFVDVSASDLLRYRGNWRTANVTDSNLVYYKQLSDALGSLGASGTSRSLQYNNAGVFAGGDSLLFTNSDLRMRGRLNISTRQAPSSLGVFETGGLVEYASSTFNGFVFRGFDGSYGNGGGARVVLENGSGSSGAIGNKIGSLEYYRQSIIKSYQTGTWNNNNKPSDLRFSVTPHNSIVPVEIMRIGSLGGVRIGQLTDGNGASDTATASALLQLTATDRGFLMPTMTNAQRLPGSGRMNTPALGLQVYQTLETTNRESIYVKKSTAWARVEHVDEVSWVTTDATPTSMGVIVIPNNTTGTIEITMNASKSGPDVLGGVKRVTYKKTGGTLTLFTVQTIGTVDADASLSTASFTLTTSSNEVSIQVTGVAATTVEWQASYTFTQKALPI